MEETQATDTKTGGFLNDVVVPRSKIYVSSLKDEKKQQFTYNMANGSTHFYLILRSGQHYTQDLITSCRSRLRCYNCSAPIENQVYFYPSDYTKFSEFICCPIPHCRPGCALRTLQDLPNHHDLLSNFYLMYGAHIICAPPRFLLYTPGGVDLEQYHRMMDTNLVVQDEPPNVRSFLAPTYVSCTFMQGHQLVKDVVTLIEEMSIESRTSVGPSKARDNSGLKVLELRRTDLLSTDLSKTFAIDPSSHRLSSPSHRSDFDM